MNEPLGRMVADPRTGAEAFHADRQPLPFTLLDFWRWSVSDLVSNATRGRLAEYIVAHALGGPTTNVRDEWASYDLITPDGVRVEVKSAAYLQAWKQARLSRIVFVTPRTRAWNPETNTLSTDATRQADVYVFALLAHQDKATLDPLNVDQWTFFSLAAATLNARRRSQHSMALKSLQALCRGVGYSGLRNAVRWAAEVGHLAAAYSDGRNGMGMQYAGGPVTPHHIALWFTPSRATTLSLFGTSHPTAEQFAEMASDVTAAMSTRD